MSVMQEKHLTSPIPFIDLMAQQQKIRPAIDKAISRVLDHGAYVMGPEVTELETKLAHYCGAAHVISCSSGTDALLMVLMAQGVGPGDAVFLPSFTFTATPEVVALLGATPIFVDVLPDTYNMDVNSVTQGIQVAKELGLSPKAIIAVDLFGQPADYPALTALADSHGMWVLADAAQSFGGSLFGHKVGSLALATATSFFPAKPLGCYGDGGAIMTDDDALADRLRSIRIHGQGAHKYDNIRIGINGRLDTIQAAILLEKLTIFDEECAMRQTIADVYNDICGDYVKVPVMMAGAQSSWAQYTVQLPQGVDRDSLMKKLSAQGIPTMVYYGKSLHQQTAYQSFPTAGSCNVSTALQSCVLSLPMSEAYHEIVAEQFVNALAELIDI